MKLRQRLLSLSAAGLARIAPYLSACRCDTVVLSTPITWRSADDNLVVSARAALRSRHTYHPISGWMRVPGTFDALAEKKPGTVADKAKTRAAAREYW